MFANTSRFSRATASASFALVAAMFCGVTPAHAVGPTVSLTVQNSQITQGTGSTTLTTNASFSGATPTGSLTMNVDGGAAVASSCYLPTPNTAICNSTFATGSLSGGAHTINASFSGDSSYLPSSATGTLTVSSAATVSLNVTSQSVSLGTASATLALTGTFTGPAPSGQMTFKVDSGAAVVANCTITSNNNGSCSASYPTGSLSSGSHTITANLAGDSNYNATSATGTLSVTGTTYSLAINVAPATAATASTANLSATATFNGPTPGTNGYFFSIDSGAALGANCTITSSTTASCTAAASTAGLTSGAHTITFTVNADSNYSLSSGSNTLTIQ